MNYKDVTLTIVSPELHIFVLHSDQKGTLEELEDKLRGDLTSNPPVVYSKERPPLKGSINCETDESCKAIIDIYPGETDFDRKMVRGQIRRG